MNSPFPGMDPYLEDPAFWPDFHHTFINYWREAIADVLPESYEARLDETVHLVSPPEKDAKRIFPDVMVSRNRKGTRTSLQRNGAMAVLEPEIIPHQVVDEVRRGRIEIRHRSKRSLVAVLEMLSPTNKVVDGFAEYCSKRHAILQQKTHLVELDLLLGGRRLPLSRPLPAGDYHVLISRADKRPDCEVYSWDLRQPLLTMPIPLKPPDADVFVDLQAVFRLAYQRGRYAGSLRYGKSPRVRVPAKDKSWVMEQRPK